MKQFEVIFVKGVRLKLKFIIFRICMFSYWKDYPFLHWIFTALEFSSPRPRSADLRGQEGEVSARAGKGDSPACLLFVLCGPSAAWRVSTAGEDHLPFHVLPCKCSSLLKHRHPRSQERARQPFGRHTQLAITPQLLQVPPVLPWPLTQYFKKPQVPTVFKVLWCLW